MKHPQDGTSPAAPTHFTARRGFIAGAGFGMVSLYLLWAGYGAAPLGFGGHGAQPGDGHGAGAHGGGHGAVGGMQIEEFRALVQRFVDEHGQPDGSVRPRRAAALAPADVYLMAFQFGFTPQVLRLETGVPYRFRMMAVDVAHGASIRIGPGARIVRLRPGALVEQELTFQQPGEHLLYCTVYCGLAHDRMQGRIIVRETGAQS